LPSQETLLSGWSATQSQLPNNPIDLVDDGHNNDSLHEYTDILHSSSGDASMAAIQGLNSSIPNGHLSSSVAGNQGLESTQPGTFIQRLSLPTRKQWSSSKG
jgi:hypothetical protein